MIRKKKNVIKKETKEEQRNDLAQFLEKGKIIGKVSFTNVMRVACGQNKRMIKNLTVKTDEGHIIFVEHLFIDEDKRYNKLVGEGKTLIKFKVKEYGYFHKKVGISDVELI